MPTPPPPPPSSSESIATPSPSEPLSLSKSVNASSPAGGPASERSPSRPALASANAAQTAQGVSSPAELMSFVDTLLGQLEDKFQETSSDVLERMTTMSSRIDSLEAAISDILNGPISEYMPPLTASGTHPVSGRGREGASS